MASQTLITAAEKMYKSEFSTTDYTKLLDPAITAMKENIAEQKRITDELMGQKPIFNIYGVDEKLRPTVTAWLVKQNEKYKNAADVTSKIKDTKDPRYIKAAQEMNEVNSAFLNLKNDVDGLETQMGDAYDNLGNIAGGLDGTHHEHDMHLFANGGIYDKIIAQGIGDDGRLSYMSGEMTNVKEIKDLETELAKIEDPDSADDQIAANALVKEIQNLKEGRTGIVKKVTDYKGHPEHNTDNVGLVLAAQQQIIQNAANGIKWSSQEEMTEVAVDQIINQMKPDGVRDFMFKYKTYIDGYIENTFGFEKGSLEFENKKEELRNTDLTDEFREHLLGVLENNHIENYKPPKGETITPPTTVTYTAGGVTYEFDQEPTTRAGKLEFQLVKEVLDGKTVVKDRISNITYTLDPSDGMYYPPQQYEAKEDESGPDPTKPLPRIGYTGGADGTLIYEFGGLMQPTTVWKPKTVEEKIIDKNQPPTVLTMGSRNKQKMDITYSGQPADGWTKVTGTSMWSPPTGDGLGNDVQGAVWVAELPPTEEAWEGKYYRAIDKGVYVFKGGRYIPVREELNGKEVTISY